MYKQAIESFRSQDIIEIFNQTFYVSYNTKLVLGGNEPLYQPAHEHCQYHQIIFAHGYFSSALHEIAHWLVAGEQRRCQLDYGYWYEPDGRDQLRQIEFEKVEVLPQAIEWALSVSCGLEFDVSSDNLSGIVINRLAFKQKVYHQVLTLLETGFSPRTRILLKACQKAYNTPDLCVESFEYQGMYQLV
ncbi:elongation factor P hydroxylase [Psychromonas sp. RZ22]|uniref:elongation factor P hydroxylase n=1 Tax=Psychromonas algarum TaxID=2555643 RepID=UPI0010677FAC|nr:elongation factor P hydroxylase [Psychromonas sp. RZ22]TEW55975.1 elongation factor P hydroxylase [Psychromonas sp. RZ22]